MFPVFRVAVGAAHVTIGALFPSREDREVTSSVATMSAPETSLKLPASHGTQ